MKGQNIRILHQSQGPASTLRIASTCIYLPVNDPNVVIFSHHHHDGRRGMAPAYLLPDNANQRPRTELPPPRVKQKDDPTAATVF